MYVHSTCMVGEVYVHTSHMVGEVYALPAWWLRFMSKFEMKANIFYQVQGNDTHSQMSFRGYCPGIM